MEQKETQVANWKNLGTKVNIEVKLKYQIGMKKNLSTKLNIEAKLNSGTKFNIEANSCANLGKIRYQIEHWNQT